MNEFSLLISNAKALRTFGISPSFSWQTSKYFWVSMGRGLTIGKFNAVTLSEELIGTLS